MHLPASLRALLGGLAADLDDPEVKEILISAPSKVYVQKNGARSLSSEVIGEGRIRALAARLLRAKTTVFGPTHRFFVSGTPRGATCPIVQVTRIAEHSRSLARIAEQGGIDGAALSLLLGTSQNVCGLVVAGPRGSGKTAILCALAREWSHKKKIAVLDAPNGPLATYSGAPLVLAREQGLSEAARLGADAVVFDEPSAAELHFLLSASRPFLVTLEADGAAAVLARLTARFLAIDPNASRTAAEAAIESSVDLVLELGRERDVPRVRAIFEPAREKGILIGRPVLAERRSSSFAAERAPSFVAIEATQTPAKSRILRRKTAIPAPVAVTPPEPTPALGTRLPSVRATPILPPTLDTLNPELPLDPPGGAKTMAITADEPALARSSERARRTPSFMELGAASISMNASPPIEASGEHSFEGSELSEIRADQLVSHSFVYNIASLAIPDEVGTQQEVKLFDKTDAVRERAAPIEEPTEEPIIAEVQRTRREAQERMPTVVNTASREADLKAEATIGPDEWAAAELLRHTSGPIDLGEPDEDGGEPITSAHADIEPSDLLTGSLPSQLEDEPLSQNEMDNTQSALVSEMVSSFDGPSSYNPDEEDLAVFQTINPDAGYSHANGSLADRETGAAAPHDPTTADLEPVEKTSGAFEEDTPFSALLDSKPATLPEVTNGLTPRNAAQVSGEEFDAMIDELRDVTRSSFNDEEEMTENRTGSGEAPVKRAKILPDLKRQRRLR